jgi:hypothetical protein
MSIQKEEVIAVNAPSALGKRAEISPMIKMIPIAELRYPPKAIEGKISSPLNTILFWAANKYNNPPNIKNKTLTISKTEASVMTFF